LLVILVHNPDTITLRRDRIELRHIKMVLVNPFVTSMGTEYDEEHIIVRVDAEGVTGWCERVTLF